MGEIGIVKAVLVVGFAVAMMSMRVEGAITCNQVVNAMAPCAGYLIGNAATPAAACGPAIRGLDSQLKATADRQAVCGCLKTQAKSLGVNLGKAVNLPGICKVTDLQS